MPSWLAMFCFVLLYFGFSEQAQSQAADDLSPLISGPIELSLISAARAQWGKLSSTEISCFDRMLHHQGLSLNVMISHGVKPTNSRLAKIRNTCAKLRNETMLERPANKSDRLDVRPSSNTAATNKRSGEAANSVVTPEKLKSDQEIRDGLFKNLQVSAASYSFEYMVINLPPGSLPGVSVSVPVSHIRYRDTVLFPFNSFALEPSAEPIIADFASTLTKDTAFRSVLVVGHTDAVGTDEYNQILSKKRAVAVAFALRKLGIDDRLLGVVPMGKAQPIASNGTDGGRALNRRVEFFYFRCSRSHESRN